MYIFGCGTMPPGDVPLVLFVAPSLPIVSLFLERAYLNTVLSFSVPVGIENVVEFKSHKLILSNNIKCSDHNEMCF